MFTTIVAIGVILLQVAILILIVSLIIQAPIVGFVSKHASTLLRIIFPSAALVSLIYEFVFHYDPCILCWYQRLVIFPIAILVWTADIRKSTLLQRQVLILGSIGFAIALFHNYIDIFPTGTDVCGASGVSCLVRYVYEFGYITIPMMSATLLLAGLLIVFVSKRFPQNGSVPLQK